MAKGGFEPHGELLFYPFQYSCLTGCICQKKPKQPTICRLNRPSLLFLGFQHHPTNHLLQFRSLGSVKKQQDHTICTVSCPCIFHFSIRNEKLSFVRFISLSYYLTLQLRFLLSIQLFLIGL